MKVVLLLGPTSFGTLARVKMRSFTRWTLGIFALTWRAVATLINVSVARMVNLVA